MCLVSSRIWNRKVPAFLCLFFLTFCFSYCASSFLLHFHITLCWSHALCTSVELFVFFRWKKKIRISIRYTTISAQSIIVHKPILLNHNNGLGFDARHQIHTNVTQCVSWMRAFVRNFQLCSINKTPHTHTNIILNSAFLFCKVCVFLGFLPCFPFSISIEIAFVHTFLLSLSLRKCWFSLQLTVFLWILFLYLCHQSNENTQTHHRKDMSK